MLNQLSGLSSPPLPFTPLIILSAGDLEGDLAALREAAPKAVVRGGVDDPWTLANQNRVLVLDRCGRMVYQQTLQRSDTNLQSVQAAILSSHLDDPCGPCHLPLQQHEGLHLTKHGASEQTEEKTSSHRKMSNIANAYASTTRDVAVPTQNILDDDEADDDHLMYINTSVAHPPLDATTVDEVPEETPTETTTRKPERKKNKNKRKKGKHDDKQKNKKKKKRVEEETVMTSTSKPTDDHVECDCGTDDPNTNARGCECVGQYIPTQVDERLDVDPNLVHSIDENLARLNEILENRETSHYNDIVHTSTDSTAPHSRIVWPMDKREKKQTKNGKQNRMDLEQQINEGIDIVKEEREIVEYPETIDFFVEVEDNVLAEMDAIDETRMLGGEEDYRAHQGVRNGLSREDSIMGNRGHLLGRGTHDFVNHGVQNGVTANEGHLLGRGTHDFVNHGVQNGVRTNERHLLGRGTHDFVNHGAQNGVRTNEGHLLGRGTHDFVNHGAQNGVRTNEGHLLGRGTHDFVNHGAQNDVRTNKGHLLGRGTHDFVNHGAQNDVRTNKGHLLGRGTHDFVNHGAQNGVRTNEGHLLGRGTHDFVNHGTENGLSREESITGNGGHLLGRDEHDLVNHDEQNEVSTEDEGVMTDDGYEHQVIDAILKDEINDDLIVDLDEAYVREREEDEEQSKGEDTVWATYIQDEKKQRGEKKMVDVPKKGNNKEGKHKKREEDDIEADMDTWVGSDEIGSREHVIRWPAETHEVPTAARRETVVPSYATWREVTLAPRTHDARSSGDSEDQTKRLVLYESEGGDDDDNQSQSSVGQGGGKVALLHSKTQPWGKGKHY